MTPCSLVSDSKVSGTHIAFIFTDDNVPIWQSEYDLFP